MRSKQWPFFIQKSPVFICSLPSSRHAAGAPPLSPWWSSIAHESIRYLLKVIFPSAGQSCPTLASVELIHYPIPPPPHFSHLSPCPPDISLIPLISIQLPLQPIPSTSSLLRDSFLISMWSLLPSPSSLHLSPSLPSPTGELVSLFMSPPPSHLFNAPPPSLQRHLPWWLVKFRQSLFSHHMSTNKTPSFEYLHAKTHFWENCSVGIKYTCLLYLKRWLPW